MLWGRSRVSKVEKAVPFVILIHEAAGVVRDEPFYEEAAALARFQQLDGGSLAGASKSSTTTREGTQAEGCKVRGLALDPKPLNGPKLELCTL